MKIAHFVLKGMPFPGGIERYVEEVGPRLVLRGHRVRIYSVGYRTTVTSDHKGMEVCRVPAIPLKTLEKPTSALAAAFAELSSDSDVVHVHAFGPSLFGLLPKMVGKKLVVQGHGLEWKRAKWGGMASRLLRLSERIAALSADALTVVSRTQQTYFAERYGARTVFIGPGVAAPQRCAPLEILRYGLRGDDYVLFAARLEREKGLHYLIDAFKRSTLTHKLIVAGDNFLDGSYKREMIARAGGDPRIAFVGFAHGRLLQELFSNCSLFVLPSDLEGLPIAALEAMSYGRGCLVSDIPENIEAIGAYGFSFKAGDSGALGVQLERCLSSPREVQRVGEQARAYVLRTFDWDNVADELDLLYRQVVVGPADARVA